MEKITLLKLDDNTIVEFQWITCYEYNSDNYKKWLQIVDSSDVNNRSKDDLKFLDSLNSPETTGVMYNKVKSIVCHKSAPVNLNAIKNKIEFSLKDYEKIKSHIEDIVNIARTTLSLSLIYPALKDMDVYY